MIIEKIAPVVVSERGGFFSRADDVGEKHSGQNSISFHRAA